MKQSDDRWLSNAVEAHVGEGHELVSMLFASGENRSGANAISFWERVIFALGFAPEWLCFPMWDEPQRGS